MNTVARWTVVVGQNAQLTAPGGGPLVLERRTAALLTYLALEGPAARSRLAGLLYPEVPESTARNNLAQLLRRLRRVAGGDLVAGDTLLTLQPEVGVRSDALTGPLLGSLRFEDLPEMEAWLLGRRAQLAGHARQDLTDRADRLETAGRPGEAAAVLSEVLKLDPLAEDVWARRMRLLYLAGDRDGALEAFDACRSALATQLGAEPLPSTLRLAEELRRAAPAPPGPPPGPVVMPAATLRPPVLVGREREWAAMEEAWARGQNILISGLPGVGKTRLAQEFAASRGPYAHQETRPGDAALPYGAAARNVRRILASYPDLTPEPWVRRELSRILPELLTDEEAPEPMRGAQDWQRFAAAVARMLEHEAEQVVCTLDDDTQYYDRASFELGAVIFRPDEAQRAARHRPRLIATFRTGEVPPEFLEMTSAARIKGEAIHLDLQPLPEAGVRELVRTLDLPGAAPHLEDLTRTTGGNPLYVLETLKHLAQAGRLTQTRRGPQLPRTVGDTIAARLARLSPGALHAARAASVLQSDFDPELVAEVLGAPLMTVVGAWDELEAAQVLAGHRFTHDLVYEAVLGGVPDAVRAMLHRSAARVLEGRRAPAARVAAHWQRGGEPGRAAPWLRRAAEHAQGTLRPAEAGEWYAQAEQAYAALSDPASVADMRRARAALSAAAS
ncbi:ATP-binding protein [Deinococcus navajonensis]|uniref:ATP-binding protein n=1 Tax=Deinococcus navajonensis TaxID=309884 RepID=A0ABV8XHP0_9DEIO